MPVVVQNNTHIVINSSSDDEGELADAFMAAQHGGSGVNGVNGVKVEDSDESADEDEDEEEDNEDWDLESFDGTVEELGDESLAVGCKYFET